ncbi:MAG: FAD-dependent oxidoreductase [Carnobacterium sp.]|uniref:dihydrolipoyl dehydrogenase family protein n=1 Tax=Carnobacterium sp. TaxID=48221 RepID=UPI002FCBAFF5
MNKYTTDVAIIGFGKAGKTLAGALAKKGQSVIIIEKSTKMYGGTCINVGCLPTKSLTHSAKIIEQLSAFGIERTAETNKRFFKQAMDYKTELVTKLNKKNYHKVADLDNATVLDGFAHFKDDHTLLVDTETETLQVTAAKIVIGTGSTAFIPEIENSQSSQHIYTSEEILELTDLPQKLGIIGAGPIGLEFASYFAEFGSEVTVYQFDDSFLSREDTDDAKAVLDRLEELGVTFEFNAQAKSVEDTDTGVRLTVEQNGEVKMAELNEILVATGRIPNTSKLDVEKAGVVLGERGEIKVNKNLQSSVEHIWAVGDVKGGPQFTYISLDDYRIVLPQLLGQESNYNLETRRVYPTATFVDPTFARVGLNEKEATEAGKNYKVAKMSVSAVPKAQVLRETSGFLKVLVEVETDFILGASFFSHEAHETINLIALAINENISYKNLRDGIYTHPTMSEALNDLLEMI